MLPSVHGAEMHKKEEKLTWRRFGGRVNLALNTFANWNIRGSWLHVIFFLIKDVQNQTEHKPHSDL